MTPGIAIRYINIGARSDRRDFFENQCKQLGLAPIRIEAATPRDLTRQETDMALIRPVEMACIASHLRMIGDFLATGTAFGAFFEDDALLSDRLPAFLADIAANKGFGLDLIRLDDSRRMRVLPAVARAAPDVALYPFRSTPIGAAGYILSRKGAQSLIDFSDWGRRQFDLEIYDPFRRPGKILYRAQASPALCAQIGNRAAKRPDTGIGQSDIDPPSTQSEPPRQPVSLSRATAHAIGKVRNAVDHLVNLPRGLKTISIDFTEDMPNPGTAAPSS